MEEWVDKTKELVIGLLERMGVKAEVQGSIAEEGLRIEVHSDQEGMLIGKNGRTLDALQILVSRMVNKQIKEPVKIVLDINGYRNRRATSLTKMADRLGEKARITGQVVIIGLFNAHDRRIIHVALKDDPFLRTESTGEGEMKTISIIPRSEENL